MTLSGPKRCFLSSGASQYRGGDGPLRVSRGSSSHPLHQAFLAAGVEAGYPFTEDINGYQQEGVGRLDCTVHNGKRWSTASAYLKPVLQRENLNIETKAMVNRVLFKNKKAVGVEYRIGDATKCVRASKEVIICGGVINTPQLLMLSGVGDAHELKRLDIPTVADLPGVGKNLQDHVQVYIRYVSIFSNLANNSLTCHLFK